MFEAGEPFLIFGDQSFYTIETPPGWVFGTVALAVQASILVECNMLTGLDAEGTEHAKAFHKEKAFKGHNERS